MNPCLSIIMPVYNVEGFVADAIKSVMSQTLTDFELLIINDGSTDASADAVERTIRELSNEARSKIKFVNNRANSGYASVTNEGLAIARGDWVGFVDSDDTIVPVMFERLLDAAREFDAGISISRISMIDCETRAEKPLRSWVPDGRVSTGTEALRHFICGDLVGFQTNKIIARSLWSGVTSPTSIAYPDIVVMPELFSRAARVAYVDEELYKYTLRAGSETGSLRPTIWDLAKAQPMIYPIIDRSVSRPEARRLRRQFDYRQVYWPLLHKSAASLSAGASADLQREAAGWVRARIKWTDLAWFAARGKTSMVATMTLGKVVPAFHRTLFRLYKRKTV